MKKSLARTAVGLLIVLVGLSFLLTNLDILPFSVTVGDWWPMFVVAAGIVIFLSDMKNYLWALLLIALGSIFQLNQLEVIDINPWQLFWPAVIVVVGISVMTSRSSSKQRVAASRREDVTAILSGREIHIQSKDFIGSRVTAVCGGALIDLREAAIKKEATIDLFAFWGGIEVRVPEGVIVKNSTSAIMGGVEEKIVDGDIPEKAPVLHVIGDIVMSGVEIK